MQMLPYKWRVRKFQCFNEGGVIGPALFHPDFHIAFPVFRQFLALDGLFQPVRERQVPFATIRDEVSIPEAHFMGHGQYTGKYFKTAMTGNEQPFFPVVPAFSCDG